VCGATSRGQTHDLKERRELHRDVQRRVARQEPRPLPEKEGQGSNRREMPEHRPALPSLRDGDRNEEPDDQHSVGPGTERRRADDGKDAQRRECVGHHPMDEAEPHWAASRTGTSGAATGSRRAR